jgi:nucleotide-binding universal stress UspA family protein
MQIFRKILCPVDFSEYSNLALRYASALAKDNQAELVIYHSIPDLTPAASYLEGNFMFTVHDALKSNAASKLDEYVNKIIYKDQQITKIVAQGNPAESVLDISKTHLIDLIVMGTHGVSGYETFLMGSVTNRVLHKTTVPVLVVSKTSHHFVHDEAEAPVKIRKILCPIDLSMDNSWMAGITQSFAKKYDSEIIFLHVVHGVQGEWKDLESEAAKKLNMVSAPAREEECKVRLEVRAGDPEKIILRTSEIENVDLIIMGHHTRKPLEEIFLGSVARRVVTKSKCPVLVARTLNDVIEQHKLVLL